MCSYNCILLSQPVFAVFSRSWENSMEVASLCVCTFTLLSSAKKTSEFVAGHRLSVGFADAFLHESGYD